MLNLDEYDPFDLEGPPPPEGWTPGGVPVPAPVVAASLEIDSVAAKALYSVWSGERITIVDSPPGAGKTLTVVTVVAHLAQRSALRIIVATPTRAQAMSMVWRLTEQMPASKVIMAMSGVSKLDLPTGVLLQQGGGPGDPGFVEVRTLASCQGIGRTPDADLMVIDEAYQSTYAAAAIAASRSDQVLLVGDPGQIGPVVTADTMAWEQMSLAPHRRAPEAFAKIGSPTRLSLSSTWRLGQQAAAAIAPLYRFGFTSSRPERAIVGLNEIEPLLVPVAENPYDPAVLGAVAEQAAALSEATLLLGGDHPEEVQMTPEDVAVVVSHNAQVSGVMGQLHMLGVRGVEVGTADRLQGGEWHAVVALDPFVGHEEASPHSLAPGRLCVMASRHRTHLSWMHDGAWAKRIADGEMSATVAKQCLTVRQLLCA